jgi:DNA-binding IclR family transcriptional regulator
MQKRATSTNPPFGQWPVSLLSHDVLAPNETINLNPFARVRERGEMGDMAKSAIRALDIIEFLARAEKPLRAVEISSALGLSPSSTHQLLKTMMDAAYLIFDPFTKRYHPSPRAANTGTWLAKTCFVPGAMDRLIEAAQRDLGKVIAISASQGSFMQIVELFEPGPPEPQSRPAWRGLRQESIGVRVPLFGSCTGAAWLATQSDERVLAAARLCRRALGEQGTDSAHILEFVQRVRAQGYAFGGVTANNSSRAIAVAMPPNRDGLVLVMTVSAPTEEAEERREEIARILKENIQCHLGGGGG